MVVASPWVVCGKKHPSPYQLRKLELLLPPAGLCWTSRRACGPQDLTPRLKQRKRTWDLNSQPTSQVQDLNLAQQGSPGLLELECKGSGSAPLLCTLRSGPPIAMAPRCPGTEPCSAGTPTPEDTWGATGWLSVHDLGYSASYSSLNMLAPLIIGVLI